jgi:hypothetical protein
MIQRLQVASLAGPEREQRNITNKLASLWVS